MARRCLLLPDAPLRVFPPIIAWPRRWAFWFLARNEERCGLYAHERRVTPPGTKRPASLRAAGKMTDWYVETLGRIADTPFAFLLPFSHFSSQRGSWDNGGKTLLPHISHVSAPGYEKSCNQRDQGHGPQNQQPARHFFSIGAGGEPVYEDSDLRRCTPACNPVWTVWCHE